MIFKIQYKEAKIAIKVLR